MHTASLSWRWFSTIIMSIVGMKFKGMKLQKIITNAVINWIKIFKSYVRIYQKYLAILFTIFFLVNKEWTPILNHIIQWNWNSLVLKKKFVQWIKKIIDKQYLILSIEITQIVNWNVLHSRYRNKTRKTSNH